MIITLETSQLCSLSQFLSDTIPLDFSEKNVCYAQKKPIEWIGKTMNQSRTNEYIQHSLETEQEKTNGRSE